MITEILALAVVQAAPPVPPPPPITLRVEPAGVATDEWFYSYEVGQVTCGAEPVRPVDLLMPYPSSLRRNVEALPFTLEFAIDETGRPQSIRMAGEARLALYDRDVMPSLRASRFAVAGATTDCRVTYTPKVKPMADATLQEVALLGVVPRERMSRANWERLGGGDCVARGFPPRLLKGFPDYRRVEGREGAREWNYVRFDIDAQGRPANVRIAYSSGDAALEEQGVNAVRQDRFTEGPRTGCIVSWWKNPQIVPAPPRPDSREFAENKACEIDDRWAVEPNLVFPAQYQRRAVEGWAVVRYDVAPWGEIGEVEVLAAQPSADFGEAAMNVVRRARFKPLEQGLTGCVDRVFFRMDGSPEDAEAEE